MGRKNMFIKLGNNDSSDCSTLQVVIDFVDHHNNWEGYFEDHEVQKLLDDDEIPGEELSINIILNEERQEYWAYLSNGGGSAWTEMWVEKYFPSVNLYNSSTWPHYNEDWVKWKLYNLQEFCGMNIFNFNAENP